MRVRDAAKLLVEMASEGEAMPSAEDNMARTMEMVEDWHLGPENASAEPGANPDFWESFAEVMQVDEPEARRMYCANCEYFDNSPQAMEALEAIPFNEFDADGGGRGFCVKFDFICHNLRVCQAWEPREDVD